MEAPDGHGKRTFVCEKYSISTKNILFPQNIYYLCKVYLISAKIFSSTKNISLPQQKCNTFCENNEMMQKLNKNLNCLHISCDANL